MPLSLNKTFSIQCSSLFYRRTVSGRLLWETLHTASNLPLLYISLSGGWRQVGSDWRRRFCRLHARTRWTAAPGGELSLLYNPKNKITFSIRKGENMNLNPPPSEARDYTEKLQRRHSKTWHFGGSQKQVHTLRFPGHGIWADSMAWSWTGQEAVGVHEPPLHMHGSVLGRGHFP